VATRFAHANHEPVVHCQGDATYRVLHVEAPAGKPYLKAEESKKKPGKCTKAKKG
jgi:hypothetical protein